MRAFILGLVLLITSFTSLPALAEDMPFAVGQEWTLSGKKYPEARVIVSKLEALDGKAIIYVSVIDVAVKDRHGVSHPQVISFLPLYEDALRKSVGRLVSTDHPLFEHFDESYERFKASGGAGTNLTVQKLMAKIVPMMENAVQLVGG